MSSRILIFVFASVFGLGSFVSGRTNEQPANVPKEEPAGNESKEEGLPPPPRFVSREDVRLLKSLFLMSDEELGRLRGFIQRLEKMPPERRRQMAADLERGASAKTPEQRRAFERDMRERFRRERADLLARYYATLTPEEADAERKKFLSLHHKERRAYIREIRKKLGYEPFPTENGKMKNKN